MSRFALITLSCCILAATAAGQYQTNQPTADLSIDFVITDGTFPATSFVVAGGLFTLNTTSSSIGLPFDIAFNNALQANPGTAFAGQILNLDIGAGFTFASGGAGFTVPGGFFGGQIWSQQITLTAPTAGDSTFQMYVIDPANPAGIAISQASTLSITVITPLALGDDDFSQQTLPQPFLFYGVSYSDFFIGSNGQITFGSGSTDFSESLAEFLANEPGVFTNWVDFNPGAGGSAFFTSDPILGTSDVSFVGVPEFGTNNSNTFNTTFFNGIVIMNYSSIQNVDALVGLTPGGSLAAGLAIDLSSVITNPILLPGTSDAPFELFDAASPNDLNALALTWILDPLGIPSIVF